MEDKTYRDIRVFRFRAPLIKRGDIHQIEFRADGPVPVYNDNQKLIGFATVVDQRGFGLANCAIDPANPERLDLETNSRTYWLDAILEFRGFLGGAQRGFSPSIAYVKGLVLTAIRIDGQEPIDANLVELS